MPRTTKEVKGHQGGQGTHMPVSDQWSRPAVSGVVICLTTIESGDLSIFIKPQKSIKLMGIFQKRSKWAAWNFEDI